MVGHRLIQGMPFHDYRAIRLAAWSNLLGFSSDCFYVKDDEQAYVDASRSFAVMQGFRSPAQLMGKRDADFMTDPEELARCQHADQLVLEEGRTLHSGPTPVTDKDGKVVYYSSTVTPLRSGGDIIGLFCIMLDVTESVTANQELDKLSQTAKEDSLTGLLNHEAAMLKIQAYFDSGDSIGLDALFMIDIDDFKSVNDTFGHPVGDKVIRDFARVIASSFRNDDIVGRVGGDEFLALMRNVKTRADVRHKAQDLIEALQYTCEGDACTRDLTGSVGVSIHEAGESLADLYSRADNQLYRAKTSGKNRYSIDGVAAEGDSAAELASMLAGKTRTAVHLRSLLQNMDGFMLICEVGEDIRFTYASPGAHESIRAEVTADGDAGAVLGAILPEDRIRVERAIHKVADQGGRLDIAYRVLPRGSEVPCWRTARGSMLPPDGSGVGKMLVVVQDSTAFNHAEIEMRTAWCIAEMALAHTGATIWRYDLESQVLECLSRGAGSVMESDLYTDDLANLREDAHIADGSRPSFQMLLKATKEGVTEAEADIEFITKDGSTYLRHCIVRSIYDDNKRPVCSVMTAIPVDGRQVS